MLIITHVLRNFLTSKPSSSDVSIYARLYLQDARTEVLERLLNSCSASEKMALNSVLGSHGVNATIGSLLNSMWSERLDKAILDMKISSGCGENCWSLIIKCDDFVASLPDCSEEDTDVFVVKVIEQISVFYYG